MENDAFEMEQELDAVDEIFEEDDLLPWQHDDNPMLVSSDSEDEDDSDVLDSAAVDHTKPRARIGHVEVGLGKFVFLWGGYTYTKFHFQNITMTSQNYLNPSHLWLYHTDIKQWFTLRTNGASQPAKVSGSGGCIIHQNLYIFGGFSVEHNVNTLWRLNLATLRWEKLVSDQPSSRLPSPRDKHMVWSFKHRLYSFGGFGPSLDDYLKNGSSRYIVDDSTTPPFRGWNNQLLVFDTEKLRWYCPEVKGDAPNARAAAAVGRIDSLLYLFGGRHQTTRLNDMYVIDLDEEKWKKLDPQGNVPCGRSWHTLSPVQDKLLLFGGFSQNNLPLGDTYLFDPACVTFTQIDRKPAFMAPRMWHTAVTSSDNEVIIFGGCRTNILSESGPPELNCGNLLVLHPSPLSLRRLCMETLHACKDETRKDWHILPGFLYKELQMRDQGDGKHVTVKDLLANCVYPRRQ